MYEVGIEVEPAEKFDLSDFVEDGNVRKIHNGGEDSVIVYDLERTEKGCYRACGFCGFIVYIIYRSSCLMQRNKQQDWLGI